MEGPLPTAMLLRAYLIVYFVLIACALFALWQGRVLARLPFEWVALAVVAALVLGVLLFLLSSRNHPANPA
jgi:hypothetical protein